MGQNAAVATVDGDAREAGSAACWAQHLVICQSGRMQVDALVRAQVEGPCVMRVSQGVPKTDEVVQGRIFTAVWPQTQQRHRTLWLASIQRPGLDAISGIVIELQRDEWRIQLLQ